MVCDKLGKKTKIVLDILEKNDKNGVSLWDMFGKRQKLCKTCWVNGLMFKDVFFFGKKFGKNAVGHVG